MVSHGRRQPSVQLDNVDEVLGVRDDMAVYLDVLIFQLGDTVVELLVEFGLLVCADGEEHKADEKADTDYRVKHEAALPSRCVWEQRALGADFAASFSTPGLISPHQHGYPNTPEYGME